MYYTVIKHDGNLRTREKFRKHEPQAYTYFTLIETSLQRPPLYNGQIIRHQGGRCREVELYFRLKFCKKN